MVPPPKNLMDEIMKQLRRMDEVSKVVGKRPSIIDASMDLTKTESIRPSRDMTGFKRLLGHQDKIMQDADHFINPISPEPRLDALNKMMLKELDKPGSTKNLPLPAMIAGLGLQGWEGTTPQEPPPPESILSQIINAINTPSRKVGESVTKMMKEAGTAQKDAWKKFLSNPTAENSVDIAGDLIAPMGLSTKLIEAWHGSPVRGTEKFLKEFIGSGEGNAAYGVGHYSAENPSVADWYRKMLTAANRQFRFTKEGKDLTQADILKEYFAPGNIVSSYGGGKDKVLQFVQDPQRGWAVQVQAVDNAGNPIPYEPPRVHSTDPQFKDLRQFAEQAGWKQEDPGALYKVGIDADRSKMLDWQSEISQQHPLIQEVADGLGVRQNSPGFFVYDRLSQLSDGTGQMSRDVGAAKAAEVLDRAGVPGVKYFDFASRNPTVDGKRLRNFVTFDPERVKILEMLGLGGLAAGNLSQLFGEPKKNDPKRSKPNGS